MKSLLGMFATLLSVTLLTIYPVELNAQDNGLKAQGEEKPWQCKGKCRTWVVYESGGHMVIGDKFQIQQLGANVSFAALSQLKGNWKKDVMDSVEIELTQIEGKQLGQNSRLCGFVDIPSDDHVPADVKDPASGTGHMFKIKLKNKNSLQITWKPVHSGPVNNLDKTAREAQCTNLDENHGGVAHAEPN